MDEVHICYLPSKDQHWWRRFCKTPKQVDQLGFLFDVLHFLGDIQTGRTWSANMYSDGLDQGTLGKVLDPLRHGGTEKQGLSLTLEEGEDGPDVLLKASSSTR